MECHHRQVVCDDTNDGTSARRNLYYSYVEFLGSFMSIQHPASSKPGLDSSVLRLKIPSSHKCRTTSSTLLISFQAKVSHRRPSALASEPLETRQKALSNPSPWARYAHLCRDSLVAMLAGGRRGRGREQMAHLGDETNFN